MKSVIQNLISILVLLVLIGLSVLSFTSCSIEHHLSKSQKHKDTAIRKGAVIKPDTVWQHTYSTELVFDSSRNAYFEKTIIKDSFPYLVTNTISAGMTRQERKALESYYKHLEKMMKLQNDSLSKQLTALIKTNKQNNKTERVITKQENKKFPWFWFFIATSLIFSFFIIKQFKK
jgi:hypothetical protein